MPTSVPASSLEHQFHSSAIKSISLHLYALYLQAFPWEPSLMDYSCTPPEPRVRHISQTSRLIGLHLLTPVLPRLVIRTVNHSVGPPAPNLGARFTP